MPRKRPLNWALVRSNVAEAREELARLEKLATSDARTEGRLEVSLAHAYHHLNVAWNARRIPMSLYASLTDAQFNAWGAFPGRIRLERVGTRKAKRPRRRSRGA